MTQVDPASETPQKKPNSGAWQLRLILLITFVPLIAAYVAYYTGWGVPESTVNNGALLSPALDVKPIIETSATESLPSFEHNTKWRIVVPVPSPCNAACEQNLYITRQVHVRLGEKAERVDRYALAIDGEASMAYLESIAEEHPRLGVIGLTAQAWQNWWFGNTIPKQDLGEHFYFLVDPQGFAMLIYNEQHDGNQLLKDIKRILRFTPDE